MVMGIKVAGRSIMAITMAGILLGSHAPAGDITIQVREMLNQTYATEWVSYPITAKKGECRIDGVTVTSEKGAVAAQLADAEFWPGSDGERFVKSAMLHFLVDGLKPLETKTYRVALGNKPAAQPKTDLSVKSSADNVEITTAHAGVRLPLGNAAGVAGKPVPPMLAMRLGNGAWTGGGNWTDEAAGMIGSVTAELTDVGPVFARVRIRYTLADGAAATFGATVLAGDNAVRWDMRVEGDLPGAAIDFHLPPVPGATERVQPKGYGQWARDRREPLTPSDKPICSLAPDASVINIFAEHPPYLELSGTNNVTVTLHARHHARWVDPAKAFTHGGLVKWRLNIIEPMWENWKRKTMPITYTADGKLSLRATLAKGERWWLVASGAPSVGERLNDINSQVLDWKADKKRPHPRAFLNAKEIEAAYKRLEADEATKSLAQYNRGAAGITRALRAPEDKRAEQGKGAIEALKEQLALLGRYDVMRRGIANASLYDAAIDSPLVTPEERTLLRAQMAHLAYVMADPATWSMERGLCSGNPNMSVSYTLTLGVMACILSDHPQAKAWSDHASGWLDVWLDNEVGENGEWLPEGSHYGFVSLEPMLAYAIAAKKAGFRDFTNDARLKKLTLYFAKMHTPRDPQRKGLRVSGAYGRGTSGDRLGVFGIAAVMTAKSDPLFSKHMQWLHAEMGYPILIGDARFGGYEPLIMDRTLPMEAPAWGSERFPGLSALLRAGFNTPHESYVNALLCVDSEENLDIWTPGVGGISQWFGRGAPLSTCFTPDTGYNTRHELLRDGVRLARDWNGTDSPKGPFGQYTETRFETFSPFATADYTHATFVNTRPDTRDWFPNPPPPAFPKVTPAQSGPLTWTRQILFLKDIDPSGPAWLMLRDTTRGGQPTTWQFWTLSEKLGSTDEAKSIDAFLADKPGNTLSPARRLPQGERYTALGQQGVDVEYFVAAPEKTPRDTMRYGGAWAGVQEYQDALHLQLTGDGAYVVALWPRPRAEAAPTFARQGDSIIKAEGAFGTDYAFLAETAREATLDDVHFSGTAAAVQKRKDGLRLTLGEAGKVTCGGYELVAEGGASLALSGKELTIRMGDGAVGKPITLTVPKNETLVVPKGTKITTTGGNTVTVTPDRPGELLLRLK